MERSEREPVALSLDAQPKRYPDVVFDVERLHLFQGENEIFEISDTTRLNRTLTLLKDNLPQLEVSPTDRKSKFEARKNYLRTKISATDPRPRREVVDTDRAYSEATRLLRAYNHPAIQLAEQIDARHNPNHEHDFEMKRLGEDIVTVVAWDQLRHIFESQINGEPSNSTLVSLGAVATNDGDPLQAPTPAA